MSACNAFFFVDCRVAAVEVLKVLAEKSSDPESVAAMLDILCKVASPFHFPFHRHNHIT